MGSGIHVQVFSTFNSVSVKDKTYSYVLFFPGGVCKLYMLAAFGIIHLLNNSTLSISVIVFL